MSISIKRNPSGCLRPNCRRTLLRLRNHQAGGQRGDAIILVLIAAVFILMLPLILVSEAQSALPAAQSDTNYNRAMAAIDAGVSDYLNRLNQASVDQAPNYWQYSSSNLPPDANGAFTGWVSVPGSPDEYFHYNTVGNATSKTGDVVLDVTGYSNSGNPAVERTAQVTFRTDGFLDYLLLTDKSLVDPALAQVDGSGLSVSQAEKYCNYRWDQPNTYSSTGYGPKMSKCSGILNYYVSGQVFNGPILSNDLYYLFGSPTFNSPIYSANTQPSGNPASSYWTDPTCLPGPSPCPGDNPTFNSSPPSIQSHATLTFPTSDSSLQAIAQTSGCLYQGPTSIQLYSDGKMSVNSPESPPNPACISATPNAQIPLPPNGVIYVANAPSGSTPPDCPVTIEHYGYGGSNPPCGTGDAFIQGDLSGQLTVAADNNVYITGDLEYVGCAKSGTSDVLGLIANGFVYVSQYFEITNNASLDVCGMAPSHPLHDPVIYAAMLALQHSFAVDQFWSDKVHGSPYEIYINGSLAGEYADIEGTFSPSTGNITDGYLTNYSYDNRLQYLSPPYFLSGIGSAWKQANFAEIFNPAAATLPSVP